MDVSKDMVRILFIQLLITFCLPNLVKAQDVVGMRSDSIKILMSRTYPEYILNTTNVNKSYNYLKYEDFLGTQTILMFLSDSNTCRYVKRMCSYSLLDKVIDQLNTNYEQLNDTLWTFNDGGNRMTKQLEKEDWFFTVVTRIKQ